jgi:hypothetical protein
MILTARELMQLNAKETKTNTNYYVNLEDGVQYKPQHHTTHLTKRDSETAKKHNRRFSNYAKYDL